MTSGGQTRPRGGRPVRCRSENKPPERIVVARRRPKWTPNDAKGFALLGARQSDAKVSAASERASARDLSESAETTVALYFASNLHALIQSDCLRNCATAQHCNSATSSRRADRRRRTLFRAPTPVTRLMRCQWRPVAVCGGRNVVALIRCSARSLARRARIVLLLCARLAKLQRAANDDDDFVCFPSQLCLTRPKRSLPLATLPVQVWPKSTSSSSSAAATSFARRSSPPPPLQPQP